MEDSQAATDVPVISFKKRGAKGKSNIRKREATPPPASDSESGFTSSEDEEGRTIKRRRKNAGLTATSATTKPSVPQDPPTASSAAPASITSSKDDATKTSHFYDTPSTTSKSTSTTTSQPKQASTMFGPQKSSTNVRTITTTDFAPDVCKDYKQTGFCGFGDSCKFLHAREDYKQGWQLDRDWEINTKGKQQAGKTFSSADRKRNGNAAAGTEEEDEDKMLESIPFACIICKSSYKNPIVTKCGHYFCESCALKRYRKDPSCAACGAGTGGVFNVAKKLNKLLERKREREEEKKEKEGEREVGSK